ncbi:MAG: acyltransferase [Parvicellaceae bacterium]
MIYGYNCNGILLKDTRVGSTTTLNQKKNLIIEDNVFIGHYNFIEASNGIKIEEGCQITNFISIISHSSHNSIRYYGKKYRAHKDLIGYVKGEVKVGKYTFVGPHTTILPNTKIGKGCLISSYSLVKGEYPDFSIIAGNPAKVIGNTKDKDLKVLKNYPELMQYYNQWAK